VTPHSPASSGGLLPSARPVLALAALAALALAAPAAASDLSLDDAIRAAWRSNLGLAAAGAQVEAARADASAAGAAAYPTLSVQARAVRTDEPMTAFGLRLDQGRIAPADFAPSRLNDPPALTAIGAGVTLTQPIFAGGRISAGHRALGAVADAEAATRERRSQELALGVTEAYFGAQAAAQGLRFADDLLAQAQETERFVKARNGQGLALDADVARATAFRASAEAERAAAAQRVETARSALVLLAGDEAASASLTTPLEGAPAPLAGAGDRPDLRAARLRRDAARAGVSAARGALLPELAAQASLETLRTQQLDTGTSWYTVGVVARWQLGVADARHLSAARARARAAEDALGWLEREARRDADEARRAVETAAARARSADEAVAASESARTLRLARHRQGLLPLTDVLDAEAGLAGARALLLQSRLEARVARARLALALGTSVEGITP
jgi:outer membrane protein TolC